MLTTKIEVAIVGAAGKKGNEYLNALLKRPDVKIAAVVINKTSTPQIEKLEKEGIKVFKNGDTHSLLSQVSFDTALISVPHFQHDSITKQFLNANKYIIKEKPLAFSVSQVEDYQKIISTKNILPVFTTVQRSILPSFVKAKTELPLIGKPLQFEYQYWLNISGPASSWRAKKETACGGVILDMGYHVVDIVLSFFQFPVHVKTKVDYKYSQTKLEKLEDFAEINLEYKSNLSGKITLDRHGKEKKDIFTIKGDKGEIKITQTGYQIFDEKNLLKKEIKCPVTKEEEIDLLLKHALPFQANESQLNDDFKRNKDTVKLINQIYSSIKP